MADSSKKDTPAKDSAPETEKKEEEKPAVVEEVISIEDGQFPHAQPGLSLYHAWTSRADERRRGPQQYRIDR